MMVSYEYELGCVLLLLKMSIASLIESAPEDVRVRMKNRLIPTCCAVLPTGVFSIHNSHTLARH